MRRALVLLVAGALAFTSHGQGITSQVVDVVASAWVPDETPGSSVPASWTLHPPSVPEEARPVPAAPSLRRLDPPSPPETTPPPGRPRAGTRFAVVVGINDYPGGDHDLNGAVNDARSVRRALVKLGFPPGRVRVLLNGQATRGRILEAARWLGSRTGPGMVGAFFYAGHVRRVDGDRDGDGEPVDTGISAVDRLPVYDGELARALRPARGQMWIGIAGCYAAGFDDLETPGRVLHYASGKDELAYESSDLERSFLAEYVVRQAMLDGDALTAEDAFAHARRAMRGGSHEKYRPLQRDLVPGKLTLATPRILRQMERAAAEGADSRRGKDRPEERRGGSSGPPPCLPDTCD